MPKPIFVRILPVLPMFIWASCAALGMEPLGARSPGKVPLTHEPFAAPRGVVQVAWHKRLQSAVPFFSYHPQEFASAAVSPDGQLVYVGSSAKTFYAFHKKTGEIAWKRELTGEVSSQPLVLDATVAGPESLVLVGDDDGVLSALSATTGAVRWTYRAHGPIHSQPIVHGGLVYFTSNEGRIYGLDVRTGKWVWQYEREISEGFAIRGNSGVLPVGNRVYVGFPDGYLACLNGETGEVVWTRQLSGDATRFTDVDGTPVLVGDTLYVSCYATGVYALDPKDGSTRWRFELETAGPLAVDASGDRIYVVSASQGLFCLDAKGRKLWRQSFAKKGELSQPILWGPYLLLSAAVDGLYILDQRTGELLQYFDPGQGATAKPMAQGDRVYVLSNAGAFFALSRG